MKASLEFDLDNPDDRMAHLRCVKSTEMAIALFDIICNAHRHCDSMEKYRERIVEICKDLNVEELIS